MSPELETLDQLLGGYLPLPVVRRLFGDDGRFLRAMEAMIQAGEVRLHEVGGAEVPQWRRREILKAGSGNIRVAITDAGAERIA